MKKIPKILITPGEPAGIGYDIIFNLHKKKFSAQLITLMNIDHLKERSKILKEKVNIINVDFKDTNLPKHKPGNILVHNIQNNHKVKIGKPSTKHVPLIIKSLDLAIKACLKNEADAMVTGPVQKNIIMQCGNIFTGHTEYIARKTGGEPIMMLHSKNLKIALLTTHVPLSKVSKLITKERLISYVKILNNELYEKLDIKNPKIKICGLNPHAGENGFLGLEEKNIIEPAIKTMQKKGYNVSGPYSADTVFTRKDCDLILAMYHDQALPVIKTIEFGSIVNTTLGLPIIRTSVDHGTALDLAGTNKADASSLIEAIKTSIKIVKRKNAREYQT